MSVSEDNKKYNGIKIYDKILVHLSSRSSTCTNNHSERAKFWSDTKVQALKKQISKAKYSQAKTFKYMNRVVRQMQN